MVTTNLKNIVKVQYFNETSKQFGGREFSYFAEDNLKIGDVVNVPVRDSVKPARVSAINIPESEIAAFRDAMKTIPAGALPHEEKPAEQPLFDVAEEPAEAKVMEAVALDEPTTAIININPAMTPGYIDLKGAVTNLKEYAQARVIRTDADLTPATDDLALINKLEKELTALKDSFVKPVREHLDTILKPFTELSQIITDAKTLNKTKIAEYSKLQMQKAAEIEEINRQALELARKQAALNNGEFTVNTTPIAAPAPVQKISTQSGAASIVNLPPEFAIENEALIPHEYWILDEKKIGRVIRAGGTIPGVKVIQRTGVRVTARG